MSCNFFFKETNHENIYWLVLIQTIVSLNTIQISECMVFETIFSIDLHLIK